MKTRAVLGGSFNPAHPGHFDTGQYIHQKLGVDEVWMLYSINSFKDPASYASIEHRMAMGNILAAHYPGTPFVMSDIETRLNTHETYAVLKSLSDENPDTRFIWVMGMDNVEKFHLWQGADRFIQEYPIAIVDRPGYKDTAMNSEMVKRYGHLQVKDAFNLAAQPGGWCLLEDNPLVQLSSSAFVSEIQNGRRAFPGPQQQVFDYIEKNGLYGCKTGSNPVP